MKHFIISLTLLSSLSCIGSKINKDEPTFAKWEHELSWYNRNMLVEGPLAVYDEAEIAWFNESLKAWNQKNCILFVKTNKFESADIVIRREGTTTYSLKHGKKIKRAGAFDRYSNTITIYVSGDPRYEYAILVHELGHALGLKHDYDLGYSIMKPGVTKAYTKNGFKPSPSKADLNAVKETYCR